MTLREFMKIQKLERDIRRMKRDHKRIFFEAERRFPKNGGEKTAFPRTLKKIFRLK